MAIRRAPRCANGSDARGLVDGAPRRDDARRGRRGHRARRGTGDAASGAPATTASSSSRTTPADGKVPDGRTRGRSGQHPARGHGGRAPHAAFTSACSSSRARLGRPSADEPRRRGVDRGGQARTSSSTGGARVPRPGSVYGLVKRAARQERSCRSASTEKLRREALGSRRAFAPLSSMCIATGRARSADARARVARSRVGRRRSSGRRRSAPRGRRW